MTAPTSPGVVPADDVRAAIEAYNVVWQSWPDAIDSANAKWVRHAAMYAALVTDRANRPSLSEASRDVLAEHERQTATEGWSASHDDTHLAGELVRAACVYAQHAIMDERSRPFLRPSGWPWDDASWKPADQRRELVKAAALLHAEIERIDRIRALADRSEPRQEMEGKA